jgi:hypothetical protein
MSSGPTLTGGDYKSSIKTNYINIKLTKHMWCGYSGKCKIDDVIFNQDMYCLLCQYRKPLSIPKILNDYREDK